MKYQIVMQLTETDDDGNIVGFQMQAKQYSFNTEREVMNAWAGCVAECAFDGHEKFQAPTAEQEQHRREALKQQHWPTHNSNDAT